MICLNLLLLWRAQGETAGRTGPACNTNSFQEPGALCPMRLNNLSTINYEEFNFARGLNVFTHCDFLHLSGAGDGRKKSDQRISESTCFGIMKLLL